MGLREELVGHCTLVMLALVGLALYSVTYSITYAGGTTVVAILEMWMVSTQIASAVLCAGVQLVTCTVMGTQDPIPNLAESQCSLFLGIACAVSILGSACLNDQNMCMAFYGAAALPSLAASGSIAWAWVVYVSALGCQTWETGISLGISHKGTFTVATVMALVPHSVVTKLSTTCGKNQLCGCSATEMTVCCLLALIASHAGAILTDVSTFQWAGACIELASALFLMIVCGVLQGMNPTTII